jgi:betaine-aldehyde dehydrogenase
MQAGYTWVNETGKHFLGAPFGGFKQSGVGSEECLGALIAFTQEKNIHINLRRGETRNERQQGRRHRSVWY